MPRATDKLLIGIVNDLRAEGATTLLINWWNGYCHLSLSDKPTTAPTGNGQTKVRSGTNREIYTFLQGYRPPGYQTAATESEIELLETVTKYLDHPDVTAMPFVVPSANVAQAVRRLIDSKRKGER
jgi:hypothetical protein